MDRAALSYDVVVAGGGTAGLAAAVATAGAGARTSSPAKRSGGRPPGTPGRA
jgi:alkyl hydroperoxide reductase subunit AhpF